MCRPFHFDSVRLSDRRLLRRHRTFRGLGGPTAESWRAVSHSNPISIRSLPISGLILRCSTQANAILLTHLHSAECLQSVRPIFECFLKSFSFNPGATQPTQPTQPTTGQLSQLPSQADQSGRRRRRSRNRLRHPVYRSRQSKR